MEIFALGFESVAALVLLVYIGKLLLIEAITPESAFWRFDNSWGLRVEKRSLLNQRVCIPRAR